MNEIQKMAEKGWIPFIPLRSSDPLCFLLLLTAGSKTSMKAVPFKQKDSHGARGKASKIRSPSVRRSESRQFISGENRPKMASTKHGAATAHRARFEERMPLGGSIVIVRM